MCGKKLASGTHRRNFCPECAEKKAKQAQEDFNEYWRLKNAMTLERAVKRIEEEYSVPDIEDLREAIDTVEEYVRENPQKLDSTEEYITLIILLYNHVKTICQYKVLNYRIDFCLPELKILLEIDGDRHNKLKDAKRDLEVLGEIGFDWIVVRIPTKYINNHPKQIYDAILDYKIEHEKETAQTPEYVLRRIKAIEAAKEERALRLERNKLKRSIDYQYANGYIKIDKKS